MIARTATTNRLGASQTITFSGINGINIMWPYLGATVVNPNDPISAYSDNPFLNPSSFETHVPVGTLNALVAKGYDFVRIPVCPGPWMDAWANEDHARTDKLFAILDESVNACIKAGLAVNIDLHDSYYVKRYAPDQLLIAGINYSTFSRRLAVTKQFAQHYSFFNPAMVALEVFNEPPFASMIKGDWLDYLDQLYGFARQGAPNHTLILSMENYSSVNELLRVKSNRYDPNVLWTVPPYIPAIYALQGSKDSSFSKYVSGFNWPPVPSEYLPLIARMTAAVNADGSLTSDQKAAQITSTTQTLYWYFNLPEDKARLDTYLAPITTWCQTNNISPNRIICNEFGATRDNAGFKGAPATSRILWTQAMADLLNKRGFRKALFALDAIDYGVTDQQGQVIGNINMGLNGI